jgi:hypothetical protein
MFGSSGINSSSPPASTILDYILSSKYSFAFAYSLFATKKKSQSFA